MKTYGLFFSMLVLLASCAASGPSFEPFTVADESASTVYVYRPKRVVNCCVAPAVYLNGVEQSYLKNGGYLPLALPAGEHEITVGDGRNGFTAATVSLNAQSGQSHYLRWDIGNMTGLLIVTSVGVAGGQRSYHLSEILEPVALEEISVLKLSSASHED